MEATSNEPIIGAAIDLGSNTFRLLVAQITDQGLTPLVKRLITVRLGKGLSASRELNPATEERALQVLADFSKTVDDYGPDFYRVCGTAALRQVAGRTEFLQKATAVLGGVAVEVISGEEEAALTYLGAFASFKDSVAGSVLLVDVGGGSTELVWKDARQSSPIISSLALGAVTLTENFLHEAVPTDRELSSLRHHIKMILAPKLDGIAKPPVRVIGSGGTATSLAALDLNLEQYDDKLIQGHLLTSFGMDILFNRLVQLVPAERNLLPGLEQSRGDIILAGTAIYQ